ncbi:MAG: CBS domain-containing protein [Bdellovibrionota bacterium]
MKLRDIMTSQVEMISPDSSILEAAQKMDSFNVGALPVCDGIKIRGLITDRDITVKVTSKGLDPMQVRVVDVMNSPVIYSYDDLDATDAARLMEACQVRRLVIVNRQKKLVGMISLGDIAYRADPALSGDALQKIVAPKLPSAAA